MAIFAWTRARFGVSALRSGALAAAALGVVMGCGDDDGGPSGGEVPLAELDVRVRDAFCEAIFSCSLASSTTFVRMAMADVAQCKSLVPQFTKELSAHVDALEASVAAGRLTYESSAVQACLASVATSCGFDDGPSIGSSAACRAVFTGTVPVGGDCSLHEECAGDAYCNTRDTQGCPGVCTERTPAGMPCIDEEACSSAAGGDGATCFLGGGPAQTRCVSWTRRATRVAMGERCGLVITPGTSEAEYVDCAAGLACSGGAGGETCVAPTAIGAECAASTVCEPGSLCLQVGETPTCYGVDVTQDAGGACSDPMAPAPERVVFCNPLRNLACTSGACMPAGDGTQGAPCSPEDLLEDAGCGPGLYCDGARDVPACAPVKPAGGPCDGNAECASLTCAMGMCAPAYCGA